MSKQHPDLDRAAYEHSPRPAAPRLARCAPVIAGCLALAGCHLSGAGAQDSGVDLTTVDYVDASVDFTSTERSPLPDLAGQCGPAPARFSGTLCGPVPTPCTLLRNEQISSDTGYRNDAPAIVVDSHDQPIVLFAGGFVATRSNAGSWTTSATPTPAIMGSLAIGPGDDLFGLFYDGSFSTNFLVRHAGAFGAPEAIPGQSIATDGELAVDSAGCLYSAITQSSSYVPVFGEHGATWAFEPIFGANAEGFRPRIVLAPSGRPEVASWVSDGAPGNLRWAAPPDPPEIVDPDPGHTLSTLRVGFGVTGASDVGQPHLLYASAGILYATRVNGSWQITTIEADQQVSSSCNTPPTGANQTCTDEMIVHIPVDVVVSASGDVRLFFLRDDRTMPQTSTCLGNSCKWQSGTRTDYVQLKMAWPEPTGFTQALLVDNLTAYAARAAVDSQGLIHFALYDGTVRYLAVGP